MIATEHNDVPAETPRPDTIESDDIFAVEYQSVYDPSLQQFAGYVVDVDVAEHEEEPNLVTVALAAVEDGREHGTDAEAVRRVEFDNLTSGWMGFAVQTKNRDGWQRISHGYGVERWAVADSHTDLVTDGGRDVADNTVSITDALLPEDGAADVETASVEVTRQERRGPRVSVAGPTPLSAEDLREIERAVIEDVDLEDAPPLGDDERIASTRVGTVTYLTSGELVEVEVAGFEE